MNPPLLGNVLSMIFKFSTYLKAKIPGRNSDGLWGRTWGIDTGTLQERSRQKRVTLWDTFFWDDSVGDPEVLLEELSCCFASSEHLRLMVEGEDEENSRTRGGLDSAYMVVNPTL